MRFLVLGAGAIGSVLGGFLRKEGHDVALVGRRDHMEAIGRGGLRIEGIWGDHCVEGFAALETGPEGLAPGERWDAILVTTKAFDAAPAVRQHIDRINPEAIFIVVQNGLGGIEEVAEVAGRSRTAGCRVIFGVEILEPGRARVTVTADDTYAGDYFGEGGGRLEQTVRAYTDALTAAGTPAHWTEDVAGHLWAKFLYNCSLNGLGAILGVNYGQLLEDQATRRLMEAIVFETFAAAKAEGVKLFWEQPEEYRALLFGRLIPVTYDHRPSMLQDLERGRRTEIEYMNGHAVRLAERNGLDAPINRAVAEMVRFQEARRRCQTRV